jgi:Asp-tRNA(Asn)/Glu-tRNA(Gln) amidotransferase A subunit family amidase
MAKTSGTPNAVHDTMSFAQHVIQFLGPIIGNPVVVLPVGRSKEGLPLGIQVVGRRGQDMELLAVAEALTEVTGPFQHPPGY